jgi:hypothetical protein
MTGWRSRGRRKQDSSFQLTVFYFREPKTSQAKTGVWGTRLAREFDWERKTDDGELIDHAAERNEGLTRESVLGFDVEGFLKTAHGLAVHFLAQISAAEIVVREMTRFVAWGFDGLLQPGNGFIELAEFNHVGADVVVRIAEVGIELDGALAFGDSVEKAALKMVGPAEEGVGFGGRMELQGRLVKFNGAIVIAFHLCLISVLKDFPGASQGLLIHGVIVEGKSGRVKGTKVLAVRGGNLYFLTGYEWK